MSRKVIETGQTPEIFVQSVSGDLSVRGWDTPQLAAGNDPDEIEITGSADQIHLSCSDDLDLRLPAESRLHIDHVDGDASLKLLEDGLEIDTVAGSLDLRSIAGANISDIHGNFSAKSVDGDLNVGTVHGNADLKNLQGSCNLGDVQGNLDVQNVEGNLNAAAQGNARLRFEQMDGFQCNVTAEGNIYCYLPEDASVNLHLASEGEVIKVRLPESSNTFRQSQYDLTLGEGEATFSLSAGGVIYLFVEMGGFSAGPGETAGAGLPHDFGQQIARQVENQIQSQMGELTRRLSELDQLSERLSQVGLPPEETERILDQTRRASERETARTQEKMRRAQEKLERKLDAQRRKVEAKAQAADRRNRRSWGFDWPSPPTPPQVPFAPPPPRPAPVEGASEEERLMILRMLEQKKISLEEADRLLSALEGKE